MGRFGNVFILGDSYSTFEGYIPEGYDSWYLRKYEGEIAGRAELNQVSQTWWYQFIEETGANLVLNCSYSGTSICHTGYDHADWSDRSFVSRMERLIEENFFAENPVDTFFIFGGSNDSWTDAAIGELQYSDWSKQDLYSVLPAFCYLLDTVKKHLPDANVLVVVNYGLKTQIVEGYQKACEHYGVKKIDLPDMDKMNGHPTEAGMKQIKDFIINA